MPKILENLVFGIMLGIGFSIGEKVIDLISLWGLHHGIVL